MERNDLIDYFRIKKNLLSIKLNCTNSVSFAILVIATPCIQIVLYLYILIFKFSASHYYLCKIHYNHSILKRQDLYLGSATWSFPFIKASTSLH